MEVTHQLMRYVCEVAKQKNFHKAAEICHTSQPNISIQIKKLENHYNFDIFIRNKGNVIPTTKGKEVVSTFELILNQLNKLESLYEKKMPSEFKLGIFSSIAPYILPNIVEIFNKNFPSINLVIVEDFTHRLIPLLKKGNLDGLLLAKDKNLEKELDCNYLFTEPFYLGVSKKHKLAYKKSIQISDFKKERILLLKEGHCLRDNVLEFCKQHNINSYHQFESGSLETLKSLISIDYGIGFIPEICVQKDKKLSYIKLDTPLFRRSIALCCTQKFPYKQFINKLNSYLSNIKTINK